MPTPQHKDLLPTAHGPAARWPFPDYLSRSGRWMSRLAILYRRPRSFPASVSPESGLLLHSLARLAGPRHAIEIGSLLGVSSLWIAGALDSPGSHLRCIDLFGPARPGSRATEARRWLRVRRARINLALAGRGGVASVHPGDSAATIGALGSGGGAIDFALVDGDHTFEGVLRDLRALRPHLAPGAPVILHDVFPDSGCEGPGQFVERLEELFPAAFDRCLIRTAPRNYGFAILVPRDPGAPGPGTHDEPDTDSERLLLFALACNLRPSRVAVVGPSRPHADAIIRAARETAGSRVHLADLPAGTTERDVPLPHPLRARADAHDQLAPVCHEASDRPSFWKSIDQGGPLNLAVIDAAEGDTLALSTGALCDRLAPAGLLLIHGMRAPGPATSVRGVPWHTGRYAGVRIGSVAIIQKRP